MSNESLGNANVRIAFNPSGNPLVTEIKALAAELIDLIAPLASEPEKARAAALAITRIEEGAMWGVKAATFGK